MYVNSEWKLCMEEKRCQSNTNGMVTCSHLFTPAFQFLHFDMDEEEETAVQWLTDLQQFCAQLQIYIDNEVPHDAKLLDYISAEKCIQGSEMQQKYNMLLLSTQSKWTTYMHGIPKLSGSRVRDELQATVKIGLQT